MYTFNKGVFSQKIRRRSRKTVANSLSLRSSEVKPASSPWESGLPWRVLCPAGWGRRDSVAPKTGAEVTRGSCCHAPGTFWKPFCLEWEEKPRTQQRPRGEEPRCSGHSPDDQHPCRRVWRPRRPSRPRSVPHGEEAPPGTAQSVPRTVRDSKRWPLFQTTTLRAVSCAAIGNNGATVFFLKGKYEV